MTLNPTSSSSHTNASASSVPAASVHSAAPSIPAARAHSATPQKADLKLFHRRVVSQGFTEVAFDKPRWLQLIDSKTKEQLGLSYRPASAVSFDHDIHERKERVKYSRSASTSPLMRLSQSSPSMQRLTAILGNQIRSVCDASFVKDHEKTTVLHLTGNDQFRELTKEAFIQIAQLQSLDFLHLESIKISTSDSFDAFLKRTKLLIIELTRCEIPDDLVEYIRQIKTVELKLPSNHS